MTRPNPRRRRLLVVAALLAAIASTRPARAAEALPAPCSSPEARGFDFWIGDWDVVNRSRNAAAPNDETWYETGTAELTVYPVADGCALVEHFAGVTSSGRMRGFSVRAYDEAAKRWMAVLAWPWGPDPAPALFQLEGTLSAGRGVFTLPGDDGPTRYRYSWSEAGPDGFLWERAVSIDGGATWRPEWRMEGTRRDPRRRRALFVGPRIADGAGPYCAKPWARQLDFLLGDRRGNDRSGTRPRAVVYESYPILDGCAAMDFIEVAGGAGEPAWKQFRVRAYDPGLGRWVQYAIDNSGAGFERLEGEAAGDGIDLAPPSAGGPPRVREVVSLRAGGTVVWERETTGDRGRIWKTVVSAELARQ